MLKILALALGILAMPLAAQGPVDIRGLSRTWTDLGQPQAGNLHLDLSAMGVVIHPSADGHVRVRYTGRRELDLSRVRVRFESSSRESDLRVSSTPHNDFQMEIEVPRTTDLVLRMSAGELTIQGVEGNKDLRLHAGELIVQVGDPSTYGPVSASVWAGELNPGPFGEPKEGVFRSFHHEGSGRYSLLAKVKAGEVTFKP
jgi:hypothetical protein